MTRFIGIGLIADIRDEIFELLRFREALLDGVRNFLQSTVLMLALNK